MAAGLLLLGAMFTMAYGWPFIYAVGAVGVGLMAHELGHKIAGRMRCINDVHFAISPTGIGLGFASALLVGHPLATPGGVTVGDNASKKDRLIMALSGPWTNLLLFGVFAGAHYAIGGLDVSVSGQSVPVFWSLALINLYLGVFNLLPIPMFDGKHIFDAHKFAWAGSFLFAVGLLALAWADIQTVLAPLFLTDGGWTVSNTLRVVGVPGLMLFNSDHVQLPNWISWGYIDSKVVEYGD